MEALLLWLFIWVAGIRPGPDFSQLNGADRGEAIADGHGEFPMRLRYTSGYSKQHPKQLQRQRPAYASLVSDTTASLCENLMVQRY